MSAAQPAPDRRAVIAGSLGLAAAVAATAAPTIAEAAAHPDAALLALADEMDRVQAVQRLLDAAANVTPSSLEADLAAEAHDYVGKEIKDRIAATPATTLAGLTIKARAIAYIYPDDFSAEELGLTKTTDMRLIWSILADLVPEHVVAPATEAA